MAANGKGYYERKHEQEGLEIQEKVQQEYIDKIRKEQEEGKENDKQSL